MKVSELINDLKKYPPETQVMLLDKKEETYDEPELELIDVIAISEWGSEKVCYASRKWEYEDCRELRILAIK